MRSRTGIALVFVVCLILMGAGDAFAGRNNHSEASKQNKSAPDESAKKKNGLKPFADLTKDRVVVEGLFTFYRDTIDNTVLMAVLPEQFGPIFLCGETRVEAEGAFYDNKSMGRTYPFYFKRVGNNIMLLDKNLRVRADTSSTMFGAVQAGISDHLIASTAAKSELHELRKRKKD